ncbi:MAG: MauE/DoxX family redox-associated membrane protein [Gammaproteobacteria bacterium]
MDPVLTWIATLLTSLLFVSAGWHKLSAPDYYRVLIRKYIAVPESLAVAAQIFLGLVEVAAGLFILLPALRQAAAWVAMTLLIFYFLLIALSLLRGLNMDCGCSGPLNKQRLNPWLLFRNAVLAAVAFLLTQPVSDRMLEFSDYMVIGIASLVAMLTYVSFEQLLTNEEKLLLLRRR